MNSGGAFIVFEGIDGCGKDTQVSRAADYMREMGFSVHETKEPTDNPTGKRIRAILAGTEPALSAFDFQMLYVKDREEHQEEIRKALDEGKVILGNRYFFSTIAYAAAGGLDKEHFLGVNRKFIYPDLTLIFDIPVEEACERMKYRDLDILEAKREEMHARRSTYLELAKTLDSIQVIDALGTPDEVWNHLKDTLDPFLAAHMARISSSVLDLSLD